MFIAFNLLHGYSYGEGDLMTDQEIGYLNERLGVHLRAAANIVKIASKSRRPLRVGGAVDFVDGKSLLVLLTLAVSYGMDISVFSEENNPVQVLNAVKRFFENRIGPFGENQPHSRPSRKTSSNGKISWAF